jgi:hypothetical protein
MQRESSYSTYSILLLAALLYSNHNEFFSAIFGSSFSFLYISDFFPETIVAFVRALYQKPSNSYKRRNCELDEHVSIVMPLDYLIISLHKDLLFPTLHILFQNNYLKIEYKFYNFLIWKKKGENTFVGFQNVLKIVLSSF